MNFLDLFAGIGGFRRALELAGHTSVGFCEIDKHARQTYKANFNIKGKWEGHDITTISDDEIRNIGPGAGAIDIICGGFPCQAFSIAGKRLGFDDARGTLFFEICRFTKLLKPKILLLENVKGLLSHDNGRTFFTILDTLGQLGYDVEYQLLNSKNFGVPQNRERVFIIGHLRSAGGRKIFPIRRAADQTLIQVIPGKDAYRVYAPQGIARTLKSEGGGGGAKTGLYLIDLSKKETKITENARCLQARYSNSGISSRGGERSGVLYYPISSPDITNKSQNGRRIKENSDPMFTLTIQDRHGVAIVQSPRGKNKGGMHAIAPTVSAHSYQQNNHVISGLYINDSVEFVRKPLENCSRCLKANKHDAGILDGMRIRKLIPLECFRLQGFSDDFFYKAKYYSEQESKKILEKYPNHKGKRIFNHEQRIKRMSDNQLYKQAGNSVTVNVVYSIAKRL